MIVHQAILPIRSRAPWHLTVLVTFGVCVAVNCSGSKKASSPADASPSGGASGSMGSGGTPGLGGAAGTGVAGVTGGGGQVSDAGAGSEHGDVGGRQSDGAPLDTEKDLASSSGSGGVNGTGGRNGSGGVPGPGGGSGTAVCAVEGNGCEALPCCSGYDYCDIATHKCLRGCGTIGDGCSAYIFGCCTGASQCDTSTNLCGPPHVSDRNAKKDFSPINPDRILEEVSKLPISTWAYKADESNARHIGPMAQDFMAAFRVGANDKTIFQIDADGVAFAAIQSLNKQVKHLKQENAELRREIAHIRADVARAERPRKE